MARLKRNRIETSEDIKTPVWDRPLAFHQGGIVKFRGVMESSKTRVMIAVLFRLVSKNGYSPNRVFANCWIDLPGMHWLRNSEFRKVLRRAFNTEAGAGRWNKCIFLAMEADDLWSHITQNDKECFNDLKMASQSYKRNIYFLYEVHEGLSVPKYLRDKTEISIKPQVIEREDRVIMQICNGHYKKHLCRDIQNISIVNRKYRRFDELY